MNPFMFLNLSSQVTSLMLDTQTVMTLRIMGMSGLTAQSPGKNEHMVSEKGPAMMKSYTEMTKAMMAGKPADQIMGAAIERLSTKVSANRKRLMK